MNKPEELVNHDKEVALEYLSKVRQSLNPIRTDVEVAKSLPDAMYQNVVILDMEIRDAVSLVERMIIVRSMIILDSIKEV